MKKFTLSVLALLLTAFTFGQNQPVLKSGGYLNVEEFQKKTPTFDDSFQSTRRTNGDIKMWGGNDYKIESNNELVLKKTIKKDIWGVCKNDTLYLNGIPITGQIGYARVEIIGKYCFLRPSFPTAKKIQKELGVSSSNVGMMFGAIGGAIQGAQIALKRVPLIYNIGSGERILLSKLNLTKLLANHSELKAQFESETNPDTENVLLKYLVKVNESEE